MKKLHSEFFEYLEEIDIVRHKKNVEDVNILKECLYNDQLSI